MALCKLTLFWLYYIIMNIKIEMEVSIVEFWKNFPIALGTDIQWQVARRDSVRYIPSSLLYTSAHVNPPTHTVTKHCIWFCSDSFGCQI
jgi:hypothetical protein